MKYSVNENCIGCGLCESLCPNIFKLSDEGIAVAKDVDGDGQEAKDNCPAGAIEEK